MATLPATLEGPAMRLAAVTIGRRFPDLEGAVDRLLPSFDLAVFAGPVDGAARIGGEFGRYDMPVLGLDLPPQPRDVLLPTILANLERFFPLDAVLLMHGHERLASCDRMSLERFVRGLRPGTWGEVPVSSPDWRPPQARIVRLARKPATAGRWRDIERRRRERPASGAVAPLAIEIVDGPEDRFLDFDSVSPEASEPDVETSGSAPTLGFDADGASGGDGVWRADFHRANFYLDEPPFRYLASKFQPGSVLDVGCGLGGYVELLRGWGAVDALGVDGFEPSEALACPAVSYRRHDLRRPLHLGRTYDLVVCTEVAEHLSAAHEDVLLDSIARHVDGCVVFSAARPGQPGMGHVNCRPAKHWLQAWQRRGFCLQDFDTRAVRSLSTFFWFRRNLMVLVPASSATGPVARGEEPGDIEIRTTPWHNQKPRICRHQFTEPLPEIYRQGTGGLLGRLLRR
jgi:SAM-dependent methyltransferase